MKKDKHLIEFLIVSVQNLKIELQLKQEYLFNKELTSKQHDILRSEVDELNRKIVSITTVVQERARKEIEDVQLKIVNIKII